MNELFERCWWLPSMGFGLLLLAQKVGGNGVFGYSMIFLSMFVVALSAMIGVFGFVSTSHVGGQSKRKVRWVKVLISFGPFIWALTTMYPQIFYNY
jgi:hypothetical protein